jgi:hypothetical protein
MAHPYHEHRSHKHEKARVSHILHRKAGGRVGFEEDSSFESDGQIEGDSAHRGDRGRGLGKSPSRHKAGGHVHGHRTKHRMDRAKGGRAHGDEKEDRALVKKMLAEHERKEMKAEHRARGGRTKHKGKGSTHVNVIVGGQHPGGGMPPPMMPPPMPPRPIAAPPPGAPPGLAGGPPGLPPPGMGPPGMPPGMPRKRGGAVKAAYDHARPLSGGKSTPGDKMPGQPPGWTESAKHKTPVQHTDGKTDGPDIGRKKPITYRSGGGVKNASNAVAPAKGFASPAHVSRAEPTAPSPKPQVSHAAPPTPVSKYPLHQAGSKSGVGRLQKARAAVGGHGVP